MCCWVSTDLHNACCAFLLTLADIHHHKHLSLKMDEAQLTVNNELSYEVQVSWMSQRCYQVSSHVPDISPHLILFLCGLSSIMF